MNVMIQIRNVPEELHRKLKVRAANAGMSLSEYLLRVIDRSARIPTEEEMLARLASIEPVNVSVTAAEAVRAERDKR